MSGENLSAEKIAQLIQNKNINVKIYPELISTNQTAKELAANGAEEGTLIIAEHQTGGRGRLGRSFFSPAGTGLYFSLVLRPTLSPEDTVLITSAAAVAVCEAIEATIGIETQIKWVNDIFINGKKVCGILSEAVLRSNGSGMEYVILGIGINLVSPKNGFPDDIKNIAGSVTECVEKDTANGIVAETVNRFWGFYNDIRAREYLKGYRERLLLKGQNITYILNGNKNMGEVMDIDDNFRLKIKKPDGNTEFLSSGEVTVGSAQAGR